MSETSERVGLSLVSIESMISVERMIGLPSRLQRRIKYFWIKAISSIQNSSPSCPRAMTIPSAASIISSKFYSDFLDQSLARSLMCLPLTERRSFTSLISSFVSTPPIETKSTPSFINELIIIKSAWSTTGRSRACFRSNSGR